MKYIYIKWPKQSYIGYLSRGNFIPYGKNVTSSERVYHGLIQVIYLGINTICVTDWVELAC